MSGRHPSRLEARLGASRFVCGYNWKSWRTRPSVWGLFFSWCLSVAPVITEVHSLICQCKCARHHLINGTFGHKRSSQPQCLCTGALKFLHHTCVYWILSQDICDFQEALRTFTHSAVNVKAASSVSLCIHHSTQFKHSTGGAQRKISSCWKWKKIQSSVLYAVLYIEMNGLAIWTCNSSVNYRMKLQLVLFMKHHRATVGHPKSRQMIHINKVWIVRMQLLSSCTILLKKLILGCVLIFYMFLIWS